MVSAATGVGVPNAVVRLVRCVTKIVVASVPGASALLVKYKLLLPSGNVSFTGHLFIVRGDVTLIACDAWLVPTDAALHVESNWYSAIADAKPPKITPGSSPVVAMEWPHASRRPYLVDVVNKHTRIDNARLFVENAARDYRERAPINARARPVFALPLVGTGGGGGRKVAGTILRELLPVLQEAARANDVDVALVLREADAFSAAQKLRLAHEGAFDGLPPWLVERADDLAELARGGRLALFLGAGASRAAGLPLWRELLETLARRVGLDADGLARLSRLSVLDQAQLLEHEFGDRAELMKAVVEQVGAAYHSVTHALLASMPVREVVTTNYDDLFERAWRARGADYAVLPHGARSDVDRFILKLHGCVSSPKHIVLTRKDYLRYLEERAALIGMVQALMLTKHMLFVGTSLEDENFHRIVHEVRKVESLTESKRKFGTVLEIVQRPFVKKLWEDLDWIAFHPEPKTDPSERVLAESARLMEIFLDRLVARATTSSEYLLSTGYEGVDDTEQKLRDRLLDLLRDTSLHDADAWSEVDRLAARLGYPSARRSDA